MVKLFPEQVAVFTGIWILKLFLPGFILLGGLALGADWLSLHFLDKSFVLKLGKNVAAFSFLCQPV